MAGLLDPNEDFISPDERKAITQQNLFSTLLQGGMQLVAGGENLLPWQRAQMIGQAAQTFGGMPAQNQQMLANAAQQKLVGQRVAKDRRTEAADAELMKIGDNPAFLETLKQMPADLQSMIPALFKSGRARDAVTLVDNWRTNQSRETALNARENRPPPGYRLTADGLRHEYIPGGLADPAQAELLARSRREIKDIPVTITGAMTENLSAMQKIDSAIESLGRTPNATGSWGAVAQYFSPEWGGKLNNEYIDPEGLKARAQVTDIGSLKLHDRSGAAVTIGETPRLKPFIPSINDNAKTAAEKLLNLKAEYKNMLASQHEYYSPDNGFKVHQPTQRYLETQQSQKQGGGGGGATPPPLPPDADTAKYDYRWNAERGIYQRKAK